MHSRCALVFEAVDQVGGLMKVIQVFKVSSPAWLKVIQVFKVSSQHEPIQVKRSNVIFWQIFIHVVCGAEIF